MFTPTSRKFFDEWTGSGGNGVGYLNALQGDKITCEIEGYFKWSVEGAIVTFNAADKTLTLSYYSNGSPQSKGFINAGFQVDDDIEVEDTASNDGSFTIVSVTDYQITVAEAVVDEICEDTNIFGTTPITDIELFYDLVPNISSKSDFVSATDNKTVQKYYATGLDATVTTPVPMQIGTESRAWVTDIMTGDDSEAFIEGVAITDHKQMFKITHVFYMTRMWTKELLENFTSRIAPSEYSKGSHLKHIFQVNGKFDYNDPIIVHTGSGFNQKGSTGWFNQSGMQDRAEYSIDAIQYQNFVTSEFLDQLDGSIVNLVTLSLFSRSGKFSAGNSKFIVNHILCPLDESVYVGTDTTLLQNIRLDKKMITEGAAAVDGIETGTDYQALKDIQATIIDANNMAITFKIDYSSATKAILAERSVDDRLYAFFIACQDYNIATTKNIDRVAVLADFRCMDYDVRESDIFGLLDYFHCFNYPNYGVFEVNAPIGYQGDPGYVEIPFWVETAVVNGVTPTLQELLLEFVATKDDNTPFVVESKKFNLSTVRKLSNKQTIDVEETRDFILAEDSPWNRANVIRYEDGDSGTKICYKLQYGYVNRFETWIDVVQAAVGASYDVFKDIENVVQAWKRYSTGNGWALQMRLSAKVVGYTGRVTKFQAQKEFTLLEYGDAPQDGQTFRMQQKYYNEDGAEVIGLLNDAPTRIVARYYGDPTSFPSGMTVMNGYCFEVDSAGTVFDRRFASTDEDAEEGSPFSSEDLPSLNGVISEVVSANLRLSEFSNRVEIDTWYTPAEGKSPGNKLVAVRLGYNNASVLLQENGFAILQEDGFFILL